MTLLEKIKNYKWFDSPNKLRAILEELYNSIGGGTQDLQSVLDNGSDTFDKYISITDSLNRDSIVLSPNIIQLSNSDINSFLLRDYLQLNAEGISSARTTTGEEFVNHIASGVVTINAFPTTVGTRLFNYPVTKPSGTYTLATLDDIKKIDLTGRVYANNATAISGGLTVNDVYRTSTGELRIVV